MISCKRNRYFSQVSSKCDDPDGNQSCGSGIELGENRSLTAWLSQVEVGVVEINLHLSFGLPSLFQRGTPTQGEVTIEDRWWGFTFVKAKRM
ncbi:MAG: hypothetical protein QGI86_07690 [Candidatus Poribacteria bacterium]|nr:hypothetical protein [Candidatus Poribacteria bacterium]MDP6748040.1 hypothetical protein [Candidatus Poribacteria bacterium]